jgi:hypothetical protein
VSRSWTAVSWLILIFSIATRVAVAAETRSDRCDPLVLQTFDRKALKQDSSGVILDRPLQVDDRPTVHGIEVSKFRETVDLRRAYECGARFVYIRLSAGQPWTEDLWRILWDRASALNMATLSTLGIGARPMLVGGYHTLSFGGSVPIGRMLKASPSLIQALVSEQAEEFVKRYSDGVRSFQAGERSPQLPFALRLDLNRVAARQTPSLRQTYKDSICQWIAQVSHRTGIGLSGFMLAVTPGEYQDYELDDLTCDPSRRVKIWLIYFSNYGDTPSAARPELANRIARMCEGVGHTDRCVLHEYTENGRLSFEGHPNGVGLLRFIGTQVEFTERLIVQAGNWRR